MSVLSYIAIFAVLVLAFYYIATRIPGHPYPPGPPTDPLIGHLRLIPQDNPAPVFHQWAKSYGDVISVRALGSTIVVLDSRAAAIDLLDKRSAIYSNRPSFPVLNLMMPPGIPNILMMQAGKRFRKHRKMLQSSFTREASFRWRATQTDLARRLAKMLVDDGEHYDRISRWFTAALALKAAYGLKITSEDDRFVKLAHESIYITSTCPPGATPVDIFPFLQHMPSWFPGTYYANFARNECRKILMKFCNVPFEQARKDLDEGSAESFFVATELNRLREEDDITEEDMNDVKGAASAIFAAGSDTTWASILVFILTMTMNPDVQKRAQEEIDRVVGRDRLPDFHDFDSLPYLESVMQEVLRWHPVGPLGVPHQCTEDNIYNGMLIPKGATVIPNLHGMSINEEIYQNPQDFNPSRFLPKPEGRGEPHFESAFGFGRRICPGRYFASNSLWIVFATILATSNISKALDKDGCEIEVVPEYVHGLSSRPKEFPCKITSRSDKAVLLLSNHLD